MKAVEIVKPYEMRVIEVPKPELDEVNNVMIRMTAAGVCGSDMGIYTGENAAATYPRIIGHEMVGVVEKLGEGVKNLKVGDRVIINQVKACGHCYPCSINRENVCYNLKVRGVHMDGGMREYQAVPESDCYIVPECLTDEEAVMIEPATIGMQVVSRADIREDDIVLIYGVGTIGISVLNIARLYCKNIIVADIEDNKLEYALSKGAKWAINCKKEDLFEKVKEYTDGHGTTVSIDCAFLKDSFVTMCKVTGNAGRVMSLGFSTEPVDANMFLITSKELDVRGSRLQNKMFPKAIELINEGKLDLKDSVSHTFPLTEAQKAMDFVMSKDPSIKKVVLTFDNL